MNANITPEFVEMEYARTLNQIASLEMLIGAAGYWSENSGRSNLAWNYSSFENDLFSVGQHILHSPFLKNVLLDGNVYAATKYRNRSYDDYLEDVGTAEMMRNKPLEAGAELFGAIERKSETLFQQVMLTASKALAAGRSDICRDLIHDSNAAFISANTWCVLSDIQLGVLSGGKELIFVPDSPAQFGGGSLLPFAECDGVRSKYGVKAFIFTHASTDDGMYHGAYAGIAGQSGHFYSCGSQQAFDYLSQTVRAWSNSLQVR